MLKSIPDLKRFEHFKEVYFNCRNLLRIKHPFWLAVIFLSTISTVSEAQDQSNFTQFYLNPYIINPSFAGVDGQSAFSVMYRRQWMNIDGGPSIANISLHTPVNAKTSVGLCITNDKKGLLNNSALLFSFGYNVSIADHSFLRFGISAGGSWNTVDFEKLETTDPAIVNIVDQHASIAGNAGISFHHKFFHLGLALPAIFSPSYISENAFSVTEVKPFESLIIHASNRFYFNNNKNVFEPYGIYRLNTGFPSQFEFAGIVHLNHVIWAGGSYKQDFGISAVAGIKLKNMFAIGGSYSLSNSGVNELNSPTFEVSIGYLFGKHKKGTHAYSFVNTVKEREKKPHRPTASQAIAAKKKQEELEHQKQLEAQAAKQRAAEAEKKKHDQEALAKAEAERKKAEADKQPVVVTPPPVRKDSVPATHNPRFNLEAFQLSASPDEITHEQEREIIQRLDEHAANPTEHHGDDPNAHPHAERHEFVKRGGHHEELEVGDYVIGGVFKSEANSQHFAEGLNKMGFTADYGHLTEKNLWYVYLIHTTDINAARAERDRVRKMKLLRDAWLLTVHH